jgi:hypothetical protein
MPSTPAPLARLAGGTAAAAGTVLGTTARALTWVRRSRKPLHPEGEIVTGRLRRTGSTGSGVPWLDSPGTDEVLVRVSRAVGLPDALPDIHGLAVRIPVDGRPADLLLAQTGLGRLTRYVLTGGRTVASRPLTTLLPYRSPHGPLLLAAAARTTEHGWDGRTFELFWSIGVGRWSELGELVLLGEPAADADVSFDAVTNPLPGLEPYDWVRRLREPAYRSAREESGRTS